MKVFVHIGSHKTGTTAVQTFANANAGWLRDRGLLYPSFDLLDRSKERSHFGFLNRVLEGPGTESWADAEALLVAAADVANGNDLDLLFSVEKLFRLTPEHIGPFYELLRSHLPEAEFVIVCALRSQPAFLDSLYRNSFREFVRVPKPFDRWYADSHRFLDYGSLLDRHLSAARTRAATVVPYLPSGRSTFVRDFFAALGVDMTDAPKWAIERNVSLDTVDCIAKQMVIEQDGSNDLGTAYNDFAREQPIRSDYGFVDSDVEADIRENYREMNARLIERYEQLRPVLGDDAPSLGLKAIDDDARQWATGRVEAFRASTSAS